MRPLLVQHHVHALEHRLGATAAPTRRADVRLGAKTGALPRRECRARRDRGAVGSASLCTGAATTPGTTCGAATSSMISALFMPWQRFPRSQERSPQRTVRPAQADRLHRRQGSPQNPRRHGADRAAHWQRDKCHRQRRMSILPGQEPLHRLSAWPQQGRASKPHRWRSLIRMGVREPRAAAVAVLCCCTRPLNPGAQDFELYL